MMCTFLWMIALVYIPATDEVKQPRELKELQGVWRTIGGEESGRKFGIEEAKKDQEVFVFQGGSLVIRHKTRVVAELTIVVNPDGREGAIDFKHKSGKYEGKTCHAIYVLDGDKLKICTASKMRVDKPEERPNAFSTDKEQKNASDRPGKLLFILEHIKTKREAQKQ